MRRLFVTLLVLLVGHSFGADALHRFSTAGFYELSGSGRAVVSMNPAWRFHKGALSSEQEASSVAFDDKAWQVVSLPNGMEYLPVEASGGVNYRGESWYRKHFTVGENYRHKRIVLYFEAIMGKSKIWVNGNLLGEHFGGFTPIVLDVTDYVRISGPNVIAVKADNSDDPMYPPGKEQSVLDFCYFGGIYRDCWMITTSKTYITDANEEDKVADGGLFVSYTNVGDQSATISVKVNVRNDTSKPFGGWVECRVSDKEKSYKRVNVAPGTALTSCGEFTVKSPRLWSPEKPNLYDLQVIVKNEQGQVVDGYIKRIGIRSIKFTHNDGFILNGKPYPRKLIGANRHQDFAVVGNALSNNLHWRDAQKLKNAGMEVIRNAHYPQDPAFMDACDELGLFMIVNIPGWQFWNEAPIFEQRVYTDIRTIVRRDRNSPCVLMWEPILNETWYPDYFAANVHNIVKEEYPYEGCYTACDLEARGRDNFDIIFTHPATGEGGGYGADKHLDSTKVYFTREWGDNVDDWSSHNSPSRVARQWGEVPQLIQAKHYANPPYVYTTYEVLSRAPIYHVGGTLWHSFDHQRGYHPDPFYGGIMDSFRRPKFSYYMFQAQALYEKPMVFIANELTPFSPEDVTIFSNCASVRLHTFTGDTLVEQKRNGRWFTFAKAWSFMDDKELSRNGKQDQAYLLAEGLDEQGRVVVTDRKAMSRRPAALRLVVDTEGVAPVADGGDLVVVVAQMVDAQGNIKRLNNNWVRWEIEGQGRFVGSEAIHTNPSPLLWGEAPILVQTTLKAGKIKLRASCLIEGDNTPIAGEIEIVTQEAKYPLVFDFDDAALIDNQDFHQRLSEGVSAEKRAVIERKLREVELQQEAFGEKK
ncbi:MAG: glycoside hydrolase family 2 TIM barrel-domain containing protein [Mucinivorans sp.]